MDAPNANKFRMSFGGYNKADVDEYITSLEQELSTYKESEETLYKKLDAANEELERVRQTELTGKQLVEAAEIRADKIIGKAKNEAASCILRAQRQCADMIKQMTEQIESQRQLYDSIARKNEDFRSMIFEKYRDHINEVNVLFDSINDGRDIYKEIDELLNGNVKALGVQNGLHSRSGGLNSEKEKYKKYKMKSDIEENASHDGSAAEKASKQRKTEGTSETQDSAQKEGKKKNYHAKRDYKGGNKKSKVKEKNTDSPDDIKHAKEESNSQTVESLFAAEYSEGRKQAGDISDEEFFDSIFYYSEKNGGARNIKGSENMPFEVVGYGFKDVDPDSEQEDFFSDFEKKAEGAYDEEFAEASESEFDEKALSEIFSESDTAESEMKEDTADSKKKKRNKNWKAKKIFQINKKSDGEKKPED